MLFISTCDSSFEIYDISVNYFLSWCFSLAKLVGEHDNVLFLNDFFFLKTEIFCEIKPFLKAFDRKASEVLSTLFFPISIKATKIVHLVEK